MQIVCPHCEAMLRDVGNAFCPECREELHVEEPAPVKMPSHSSREERIQEITQPAPAVPGRLDNQTTENKPEAPAVRRGRAIVNCVLAFSFASAIVSLIVMVEQSPRRNPLPEFAWLVVLTVFIHKGHTWAQYVLGFACAHATLSAATRASAH